MTKAKIEGVWARIEKNMQNPEYIKAVRDFIKKTTT